MQASKQATQPNSTLNLHFYEKALIRTQAMTLLIELYAVAVYWTYEYVYDA